jgi:hypothetical protein
LPATLGRSFYLAEVDATDQSEWLRQIGITGLPGIAVYAQTEAGIKLIGSMSGMADPAAITAWVPTLWKPAASTTPVDPKVARTSYQQPSSQSGPSQPYFNPAPAAPAPSTPNYFVAAPPAAPAPAAIPYLIYQQTAAPAPAPVNYTTPAPAPLTISPTAAPIVVNPPQQTFVIGPTPAPNVVAAAPGPPPAPAPTQYLMAAPAPAPAATPVQVMATAPAPVAVPMVATAPVPAPVTQFVATAAPAVVAAPQNVVVAVKPLSLRNRIGTGLGQFLIERNRPKFEVVQAANLAAVQGAPSFYAAQSQAYAPVQAAAPATVCPPSPQAPANPEPLPPLPSAQNQCPGCRNGGLFRHNHKL